MSWLRGLGQEEDANTLRGETEELIGKDEINEQPDRVQGLDDIGRSLKYIHPAGRN
jgi:hypothetical protein